MAPAEPGRRRKGRDRPTPSGGPIGFGTRRAGRRSQLYPEVHGRAGTADASSAVGRVTMSSLTPRALEHATSGGITGYPDTNIGYRPRRMARSAGPPGRLDGLDSVPWPSLEHAFGSASDVPGMLERLSRGGRDSEEALDELFQTIWHQGTVYSATAEAVPFLAALAADRQLEATSPSSSSGSCSSSPAAPGTTRCITRSTPSARHPTTCLGNSPTSSRPSPRAVGPVPAPPGTCSTESTTST